LTAWWRLADSGASARGLRPLDTGFLDVADDARRLAALVLAEDGERDLTNESVGATGRWGEAWVRCREQAVAAGLAYGDGVARAVDLAVEWRVTDGSEVAAGDDVGRITGDPAAILRAERPLLNLLQRAFGIATLTRRFVEAVAGTGCVVLHTRKTAPGLRRFDVAAVLAGGGGMHRLGLDRVVMLKDNHWEVLARTGAALDQVVTRARRLGATRVQVEVERLEQVESACRAGVDRLLIDNQPPGAFRCLVERARSLAPTIEIEASGGLTLDNAPDYARAGADYISVGALTHSARAVDLTVEFCLS
jgi:nicotinate-nucleotide pyrophosphorylase (carboxylating)